MEKSIVEGFQNLQVLAPFDFHNMGALVEDLTYALEESTKAQNETGMSPPLNSRKQLKKRKTKKRKPDDKSQCGANISDFSESSIDEAIKELVETVTQHSDSDDVVLVQRYSQKKPFHMPASHQLAIAESDSFTENFSPMRPHRRRRKFKRMAVDPHPDINPMVEQLHVMGQKVPPKPKHVHLRGSMDIDKCCASSTDTLPGKRKHGNSGSLHADASSTVEDGTDMPPPSSVDDRASQESKESSSISSTDSEPGIYTNDEGRDGDDEQSDFFHEPGPACGIPGIIPWWDKDPDKDLEQDPNFQSILDGSFELMSLASQRSFRSRIRILDKREIRAGRRRLKDRKATYSVARFLQDRQQWKDSPGLPICSNGSGQSGDTKRRRRTPPSTPSPGVVGENAAPIPEDNVGNRLLQSMGWTPGSGLGADGSGITTPITACMRPHRQGLGMDPHSSKS